MVCPSVTLDYHSALPLIIIVDGWLRVYTPGGEPGPSPSVFILGCAIVLLARLLDLGMMSRPFHRVVKYGPWANRVVYVLRPD